jgi:hypothetical protein
VTLEHFKNPVEVMCIRPVQAFLETQSQWLACFLEEVGQFLDLQQLAPVMK